jgi:uncharacterized protein
VAGVFLDSSALVKLVRPEPETEALRRFLTEPRRPLLISELAVTEVTRAARRVGVDPTDALAECDVVLLRSEDLVRASELEPPALRTLDAIHLATALALGDVLDAFVAYDEQLLAAAARHGLPTAAPA